MVGEWTYEETFAEARGDFVPEVVDPSATLCIGGGALFLDVFGVAVEYLKPWCSRLDGVEPVRWATPTKRRVREKRS